MDEFTERLRNAKGDRSIDDIAQAARKRGHRISRSTVAKYLQGRGRTFPADTVEALAAGFGVDPRELRRLADRPAGDLGEWTPPAESASLTRDQRDALDQLIKTMTVREVVQDAGTPTPLRPAPDPSRTDNVVNFPRDSRGDLILPEGIAAYDTGRKSVGRMQNEAQDADAEASQDPRGGWDDVNQDPDGQE
ncbi:helix-turn-helix domain-containing protein [Propionibacterium freudenreichii]|uniref:helix-turn-helix domain-containing protein n=1 Tax=Propionibacterium freudenreichii TaxID=1744 RepID=UPI00254D60FE|nr:helix-turn-helix domain-containing protein [Propionibacterium freudenreichii]MDK9627048.1 helix-turn-helix domain-containing protein [Propionibacterium freudenreichii]